MDDFRGIPKTFMEMIFLKNAFITSLLIQMVYHCNIITDDLVSSSESAAEATRLQRRACV